MVIKLIFVCYFAFQINASKSAHYSLELIQVFFRHGARTPSQHEAELFNITNPNVYGYLGFNQLTNEGKKQEFNFGSLLRNEYHEFLGDYRPEEIYAYSSESTRTKQSLQLVLAGLYPPSEEDKWNNQINWRPIAYKQAPKACDAVVRVFDCPKFNRLRMYEFSRMVDSEEKLSKMKDSLDFIEKYTGIPFGSDPDNIIGWIYQGITIHKMMNVTLPNWYTDEIYDIIRELVILCLDARTRILRLKRMNGGPMVKQTLENIEINDDLEFRKKIYLYSSHDLMLSAFANVQKLNFFDIPPFGSAIIMETHRGDRNEKYIRVRSWDGSSDAFTTLKIDNCEEYCSIKDYLDIVREVIPTDEEVQYLIDDE